MISCVSLLAPLTASIIYLEFAAFMLAVVFLV